MIDDAQQPARTSPGSPGKWSKGGNREKTGRMFFFQVIPDSKLSEWSVIVII